MRVSIFFHMKTQEYNNKRWTKEEDDKLMTLLNKGINDPYEIMTYIDRKPQSIRERARGFGFVPTIRFNYWSKNEINKLIELNKMGNTPEEISEVLNRTPFTISQKISKLNKQFNLNLKLSRKIWNANDIATLKELSKQNYTARKVAEIMGRTKSSIQSACDHMGIKLRSSFRKWTEADNEFLLQNFKCKNKREIMEHLNKPWTSILKRAAILGVYTKRNPPRRTGKIKEKYCNYEYLYSEYVIKKLSTVEIGKNINCSGDVISKWLKEFNIDIRSTQEASRVMYKTDADLAGKRFGNFTVMSNERVKSTYNRRRANCVRCRCDCGKEKIVPVSRLINGKTHSCTGGCKSYFEIYGGFFNSYRAGARTRGLPFNITIQYAWEVFLKQSRKCALSGIELKFSTTSYENNGNASLDRIDSTKGYIEGNVQWIDKDLNRFKSDLPEEKLFNMVERIYNYRIKNENTNDISYYI
jgi:hypothetical protein